MVTRATDRTARSGAASAPDLTQIPDRYTPPFPPARCVAEAYLLLMPNQAQRCADRAARGCVALFLSLCAVTLAIPPAKAQTQKPNILVIMADDIGYWNISAYNRGMMGYRTPNIDRIANEGAIFTDYYGQQSCTGRSRRVRHRPESAANRAPEGRIAGSKAGMIRRGPDAGGTAQTSGLCDRTIRQEPSRRPQRVSADGARLR